MHKNRLFLNGLGLGLIAGALLLQLMNSVPSSDKEALIPQQTANATPQMDLNEIKARAGELGLHVFDKDEKIYTEVELQDQLEKSKREAIQSLSPQTRWVFAISAGMSAYKIADMLISMQIIEDTNAFIAEIKSQNLGSKIRAGIYTFDQKPTMAELIDKITGDRN
ncbi:hypothetical protein [Ferviditalea candida]|uniref:Uncharacterized protein n=1 Tax=Ferviditalea candida TaxID=3108399 RepID=A0ABU5ZF57_9BACL|nr:hypothetical protein [Paenibacillaceae bacterium T2]